MHEIRTAAVVAACRPASWDLLFVFVTLGSYNAAAFEQSPRFAQASRVLVFKAGSSDRWFDCLDARLAPVKTKEASRCG
jgi:hypothetical protein